MGMEELIEKFDFDRVSKNPAVYDEKKLTWMNGQYIRKLKDDEFYTVSKAFLLPKVFSEEEYATNRKWMIAALSSVKSEIEVLTQIPEKLQVYFNVPNVNEKLRVSLEELGTFRAFKELQGAYESMDEWTPASVLKVTKQIIKETKVKGRDFYHPLREILTGTTSGPDLVSLIFLLGRENVISRLRKFLEV